MFTKKITEADAFTELPPTTQALYFHLCMGADDDGFSNQIRKAMFNAHADRNDFDLLVGKRFIIPFESGVIVIKHWRMHNLIKSDRYHETNYLEEKAKIVLKENGVYSQNPVGTQLEPKWNAIGTQVEPQVSIGKVSLDKDSIGKSSLVEDSLGNTIEQSEIAHDSLKERFEYLWELYPNKKGKKQAYAAFQRAVKKGTTVDEIRNGIKAYVRYIEESKIDSKYIKQGSTFFQQEAWNDDWTPPKGSVDKFLEDLKAW